MQKKNFERRGVQGEPLPERYSTKNGRHATLRLLQVVARKMAEKTRAVSKSSPTDPNFLRWFRHWSKFIPIGINQT